MLSAPSALRALNLQFVKNCLENHKFPIDLEPEGFRSASPNRTWDQVPRSEQRTIMKWLVYERAEEFGLRNKKTTI